MDFNSLVVGDDTSIDDLKCYLCKNHLSYFPIHLTSENRDICGRCSIPEDGTSARNQVYEILAAKIEFPCRYFNEGCIERKTPCEMVLHEGICPFRLIKCLASEFDECDDKVALPNMKQHCEEVHLNYVRNEQEPIFLDLSKSHSDNYLFFSEHDLYIFKTKFDLNSNKLETTLYNYVSESLEINSYELYLTDGSRKCTITGNIGKESFTDFYLDVFKVPNLSSVTVKLNLVKNNTVSVQDFIADGFLKTLKCSECSKYIVPPVKIYCYENRLLCSSCGPNLCSNNNSLTFSQFDKIVELLNYPCENQKNGCKIIAKPSFLRNHLSGCAYEFGTCPVSNYEKCEWSGLRKNISVHINEKHQNRTYPSSQDFTEKLIYYPYKAFSKCGVIKFSKYLFRLSFSFQSHYFRWCVQMIGAFEKGFKYEVTIFNINDCQHKLVGIKSCLPLTAEKRVFENMNDYCFYNGDQISCFLDKDKFLHFKIRILV